MEEYSNFLHSKLKAFEPSGFSIDRSELNPKLFDYQAYCVWLALKRGRSAIFADTGLGKTIVELEWAHQVAIHTDRAVLVLAPLAVAEQMMRESVKFGIGARIVADSSEVRSGVNITNYEKLHKFSPEFFGAIVLDESSILKGFSRSTCKALIEFAQSIPYRLCASATPSPNDHMELGTHSEFLGIMSRDEMLSMYFIHDGGETSKWRLKGHGAKVFWKWLSTWAIALRSPTDLGFDGTLHTLPPLSFEHITVATESVETLFNLPANSLTEQRVARRVSLSDRVKAVADRVNNNDKIWLVWCELNEESEQLARAIPGSIEVRGSNTPEEKSDRMLRFANGDIRVLISKASICGFGMNFQVCHNQAFCGIGHSFESFYQAVRRSWRFGQTQPVHILIATSDRDGDIIINLDRKKKDMDKMMEELVAHMDQKVLDQTFQPENTIFKPPYRRESFTIYHGDCVEVLTGIESNSIDFSVFSPPFSSLYTYSNSIRDMGNCRGDDDFFRHYSFLVEQLFRVLKPGRLISFHCMNLPSTIQHNGYIGLRDFRGDLIYLMQQKGFIYHSEVVIWKDPVTAMQRTKAIGLLHKQLKKDSALSRQGIPDYLVTVRKPGANQNPISHTSEEFPVDLWQNYASPVWMDINPSDTLQFRSARENDDERHICPLQLQVIERAIKLWSNPGDLVLSPFAGIGSEGYVSVQHDRKFIGIELKESYFNSACKNLESVASQRQQTLFDLMEVSA